MFFLGVCFATIYEYKLVNNCFSLYQAGYVDFNLIQYCYVSFCNLLLGRFLLNKLNLLSHDIHHVLFDSQVKTDYNTFAKRDNAVPYSCTMHVV